jgi:putative sigma-54 modulation protein
MWIEVEKGVDIMKVEVVGKNGFQPSDENKEFVTAKLQKVENYFKEQNDLRARVVAKVYPTYQKVEVTIPTKNITLRAESKGQDLYSAVDLSLDKLEKQIRKYKTRVKEKKSKDALKETFADGYFEKPAEKVQPANLVRTKQVTLVPLSDEDAMEQLELTDHNFFLYLDNVTLKVKVLYVRDDGNYAIIETE